jgi:hypothetical protein
MHGINKISFVRFERRFGCFARQLVEGDSRRFDQEVSNNEVTRTKSTLGMLYCYSLRDVPNEIAARSGYSIHNRDRPNLNLD